jgi:hypothetical protein
MKKNKLLLYLIVFLTQYICCQDIINKDSEEKYTIIFIHGSYGINFYTLLKIVFYNIFNSNKLKKLFNEIAQFRFNKKLSDHESVCSNKRGLDKITANKSSHYSFEYVFTVLHNKFKNLLKTNEIDYYAFNWNGCMSNKLRALESHNLYAEIEKLKQADPTRKIIIIGFSHGGNIALDMKKIAKKKNYPFIIDLLILLATPIGKVSEINAKSTFFTKIINIYSQKDFYQTSDISFNFPRTKRFFNGAKNIINIDFRFLKKNKKKIEIIFPYHKYFGTVKLNDDLPVFLQILPDILEKINNKNTRASNYIIVVEINTAMDQSLEDRYTIKLKKRHSKY